MSISKSIYNLAQRLSKKSNHHTYKLGCVIFNKKEIIGLGFNQLKTHPKSPHPFHSIHAEFHAIMGVSPSDLRNAKVFVYMENVKGKIGKGKPCPCCTKMLEQLGLSKVFYTNGEGKIEFLNLN
jgi:pyrimidine deaminase RibD-like protein